MKKKLLLIMLTLVSTVILASDPTSVKDSSTIKISIQKLASVTVDDMDFQTWMLGQVTTDEEADISITGGTASATMTMSTSKTLQLSESGGATIGATLSFIGSGTDASTATESVHKITLGSNGEYAGKLKAAIGTIPDDQVIGDYEATAEIFLTYN